MTSPSQDLYYAQRNVGWYPFFMGLSGAFFWLAIFFLYFQSKLSLPEVLRLEAIYYFSVFFLEVPTGYFSDKFGRVKSLRLSAILFLVSYLTFFFADSFLSFSLAQIFLAGGIAFQSGTDTAFHYACLQTIDEGHSYADRESRIGAILNLSGGLAAFLGGISAMFMLSSAYALSALATLFSLFIAFFVFKEPSSKACKQSLAFRPQLYEIKHALAMPILRFLFLASLFATVLVHIPYEYYQTFIRSFLDTTTIGKLSYVNPTWVNGLHAAIAMTIAGFFSGFASKINRYLGVKKSVLLAIATLVLIPFFMSRFLEWWVVVLVLFRSAPHSFLAPILNAEIVPRLENHLQATYLSIQSMLGRLGFGVVLLVMSCLEGTYLDYLKYGAELGAFLFFITLYFSMRLKKI